MVTPTLTKPQHKIKPTAVQPVLLTSIHDHFTQTLIFYIHDHLYILYMIIFIPTILPDTEIVTKS